MKLVNHTKKRLLLPECKVMDTPFARLAGLMGKHLSPGEGALLRPCRSVHTFFMKEPIDLLFLSSEGYVLAAAESFKAWGIPPYVRGTAMIAEGKAGSLAPFAAKGDLIVLEP